MRSPLDVRLSLQRYTALILPAPWNIRLIGESVNPDRPFALISQNGTVGVLGKFGAHSVRLSGAYTVHAYLPQGSTRDAAEEAAAALEDAFLTAIKLKGIAVAPAPPAGSGVVADGGAKGDVVPLWDFVSDTTSRVSPPRAFNDFADVTDFQTRSIADPAEPRLQTVVCDLRLAWWRSGSIASVGTVALAEIRPVPGTLTV